MNGVMNRTVVAGGVALALACAVSGISVSAGAATSVSIGAREFSFVPKDVTVPAGEVTFVVKNAGVIEHNFVLEDKAKKKAAEIPVLEPAQTLEVKATLKPGVYRIYCTLPGHKDAGMVGTLTVQ